jgi:hypothetical protein
VRIAKEALPSIEMAGGAKPAVVANAGRGSEEIGSEDAVVAYDRGRRGRRGRDWQRDFCERRSILGCNMLSSPPVKQGVLIRCVKNGLRQVEIAPRRRSGVVN